MNNNFREFSDSEVRERIENETWQFYDRYTNAHGLKFYMFRYNDVKTTHRDYRVEWYINFLGFYKDNSVYKEEVVTLTFSVAENYRANHGLSDDSSLRSFLFHSGDFEFRQFLDTVTEFGHHDTTIMRLWGDTPPLTKNGKIIRPRDSENDRRLLRIAEVHFAQAILENNGLTPLGRIDFLDICFVPEEYLTHVERRLVRPELMDTLMGILTTDGKRVVQALLRDTHSYIEAPHQLSSLIAAGESETLEFKSSLRWDYKTEKKNTDLEFLVIRAVASFINGNGGNLIIGVADDGSILGLTLDYATFRSGNKDKFELHITQLLISALSITGFKENCSLKFFSQEAMDVCTISVKPGTKPIFLERNGGKHFLVRAGNSSREITDSTELAEYCIMRFGGVS